MKQIQGLKGMIGLGTSTPVAKLDVVGKIKMPANNFYTKIQICTTLAIAGQFCTATAICDNGDVVLGGSCSNVDNGFLTINEPNNLGDGWTCTVSGSQVTTRASARCFDIN